MAAQLRIEPDEVLVRGSRLFEPAVPVCHVWKVVCRDAGLAVDEQLAQVLDRLMPHVEAIARLSAELMADDGEQGGARLLTWTNTADDPDRLYGFLALIRRRPWLLGSGLTFQSRGWSSSGAGG